MAVKAEHRGKGKARVRVRVYCSDTISDLVERDLREYLSASSLLYSKANRYGFTRDHNTQYPISNSLTRKCHHSLIIGINLYVRLIKVNLH